MLRPSCYVLCRRTPYPVPRTSYPVLCILSVPLTAYLASLGDVTQQPGHLGSSQIVKLGDELFYVSPWLRIGFQLGTEFSGYVRRGSGSLVNT
jgi:hypothetical protein